MKQETVNSPPFKQFNPSWLMESQGCDKKPNNWIKKTKKLAKKTNKERKLNKPLKILKIKSGFGFDFKNLKLTKLNLFRSVEP